MDYSLVAISPVWCRSEAYYVFRLNFGKYPFERYRGEMMAFIYYDLTIPFKEITHIVFPNHALDHCHIKYSVWLVLIRTYCADRLWRQIQKTG